MEVAPNNSNTLASLTKDVVLEILRCLPVRSWNRLISNNSKMLPQTVAGFFYDGEKGERNFTSVTGERPRLVILALSH